MALLLVFLLPRRSGVIYAVVYDLGGVGATTPPGVTTSARRRAWPVRTWKPMAQGGLGEGTNVGGVGGVGGGGGPGI